MLFLLAICFYLLQIFLHTKLINGLSLVAPAYCNCLSLWHHSYKAVCHCSSALIHFKGIHKFIFSFETLAEQWCVSKRMCAHTKILKLFLNNFLHFQCVFRLKKMLTTSSMQRDHIVALDDELKNFCVNITY